MPSGKRGGGGQVKPKVSAGKPPPFTPSSVNRARRRTRMIDDENVNRAMERKVARPGGKMTQTLEDLGLIPDSDTGWYPTRIEQIDGDPDLNFDAAGGLMDLLQTPGFKIGLGGTGALMAILSYLGSQAVEEITP